MLKNNIASQEIVTKLDRILLKVEKPGRYVGGEYNQVIKDWDIVHTHVALAFPDIYDIGLSNLGLTILYDILNQHSTILAERTYIPWKDMEYEMRQNQIPLYSLESKRPISEFDILGITLPYETLYTNALNLLDLAKIPLPTSDRLEMHPLVIAGGHACYNPEPIAPFFDAVIVGEGEEVILEIVEVYQTWKKSQHTRAELLKALARLVGVYVPSLYTPHFTKDGRLIGIEPQEDSLPKIITKRVVPILPPPPVKFLVPSIEIVHNRITVEIMRGCTRGCRFCHAGMVNRPIRERPVDQIVEAIEATVAATGYEEVGLLSLSSSDYTHIVELVDKVRELFSDRKLTIALPSLRIESFSLDLLDSLKGSRQGGFTLAPEAATEKMRNIINKPISSEQLLSVTREIYERGWQTIKLYFMIGHPGESEEDILAISELCHQVLKIGRQVMGRRASLHVSVGTFVPKAHTPFQWESTNTVEEIEIKQTLLKKTMKGPGIKFNWTDPKATQLEAWLSPRDRRLSEVIFSAWRNGATFDAWHENDHSQIGWMRLQNMGFEAGFYSSRRRTENEYLPWEIISSGVSQEVSLERISI